MLLIVHLHKFLLVFLFDDVAFNLLSCDWRFLSVLFELTNELRLGDLAILVLIKHGQDNALQLSVGIDMDQFEHSKEFFVRQELVVLIRVEPLK